MGQHLGCTEWHNHCTGFRNLVARRLEQLKYSCSGLCVVGEILEACLKVSVVETMERVLQDHDCYSVPFDGPNLSMSLETTAPGACLELMSREVCLSLFFQRAMKLCTYIPYLSSLLTRLGALLHK